jgi:hypothetical protein
MAFKRPKTSAGSSEFMKQLGMAPGPMGKSTKPTKPKQASGFKPKGSKVKTKGKMKMKGRY